MLSLKLPTPAFDQGAHEINNNEIMIYGGFNDSPLDRVLFYKQQGDEGTIEFSPTTKL